MRKEGSEATVKAEEEQEGEEKEHVAGKIWWASLSLAEGLKNLRT